MKRFFPLLAVAVTALATTLGPVQLAAQDTSKVREGVRVVLEYQPGVRPGLVVVPGFGLDWECSIWGCPIHKDWDR